MWTHFNCESIKHFQNIYLKIDVVLLAEVFEQFRSMALRELKLDPPHFFSAPGLTWLAALKYTKIEIELMDDIDMILMVEKGIRG